MVEEAVVLVVVEEQDGRVEDLRVGGEGAVDEVDEVGAVAGRGVGVLGEGLVGDHPGDLGQGAREDVGLDGGGDVVGRGAGDRRHGGHASVVEWVARLGVGEFLEVRAAVVAVVVLGVLVDLPGHSGRLQCLGVVLPGQSGLVAAVVAGAVDLAAPQVRAVGACGAERGAEVGVADGVVVGQRVVERDVGAVEIAHRAYVADARDPVVEPSLVPGGVLRGPRMREVAVALREGLAVRAAGGGRRAQLPGYCLPPPFGWLKTEWPPESAIPLRSPKPRTPLRRPK